MGHEGEGERRDLGFGDASEGGIHGSGAGGEGGGDYISMYTSVQVTRDLTDNVTMKLCYVILLAMSPMFLCLSKCTSCDCNSLLDNNTYSKDFREAEIFVIIPVHNPLP